MSLKTRVLAVVAVMLVGCPETPSVDGGTGGGGGGSTGGGAGGGTGGGGGLTIDAFCAAQLQATCAKQLRCGAAAPGTSCDKLAIPSRGSLINARLDCLPTALRADLASGLTHYDGAKAAQCLTAIETSAPCTSSFSSVAADPSCHEVFTGAVSSGGSCYGFNECAPGLYCDSITTSVCPGTCRPRISAGGAAPSSMACELGLVSASRADGGLICIPPVAPGQSCAVASGFGTLICAGANSCQAGDGGSTCQPLKTAGQPCSAFAFAECALDMTCAPGSDGGTQCVPWRRSGESCGVNLFCLMGLGCVNGVCGPLVAEGGSCTSDLDCVAGHLCKAGSCQPFGGLDAGCDTRPLNGDCAVGLFCNAAARCEALRGRDAICSGNECSMELGLTCAAVTDGGVSRCKPAFCAPP